MPFLLEKSHTVIPQSDVSSVELQLHSYHWRRCIFSNLQSFFPVSLPFKIRSSLKQYFIFSYLKQIDWHRIMTAWNINHPTILFSPSVVKYSPLPYSQITNLSFSYAIIRASKNRSLSCLYNRSGLCKKKHTKMWYMIQYLKISTVLAFLAI